MISVYPPPPSLFNSNSPVEGFGDVSAVIYITAWVSGCCLQLVHAQYPLAVHVTEGEPVQMCSRIGLEFILRNRVINPGRI